MSEVVIPMLATNIVRHKWFRRCNNIYIGRTSHCFSSKISQNLLKYSMDLSNSRVLTMQVHIKSCAHRETLTLLSSTILKYLIRTIIVPEGTIIRASWLLDVQNWRFNCT